MPSDLKPTLSILTGDAVLAAAFEPPAPSVAGNDRPANRQQARLAD